MKVLSLNVGLPREVAWRGVTVSTGIFKEPVKGRIAMRKLNLDGDRQADLNVHGGEFKAVYCYPVSHYDYWKRELPRQALSRSQPRDPRVISRCKRAIPSSALPATSR